MPTYRLIAALALAAAASPASAARVELARNGRPLYAIQLRKDATGPERLAAEELSAYLGKITGASFPVGSAAGELPAIRLSLGALPGKGKLEGDAYGIALQGRTVHLAGGRGRSLLYAAYDLLERAGCRWLAPRFGFYAGEAETIPRRMTLALELPESTVERPALKLRKLYVEEGHSHTAENLAQIVEWMPKLRYNTLVVPTNYQGRDRVKWDSWRAGLTPELRRRDVTLEVGGHGYQNFLNAEMDGGKYWTEHPEWFGADAAGKRVKAQSRVFCTSNPDARAFVIGNVRRYVEERPEIRIFDLWPPDSARWCECAACAALGDPSVRHVLLVNEVRDAVAKVRPDLRLEVIAYQSYLLPPAQPALHRDVLLDFCPIAQVFEVQIDDPAARQNAEYAAAVQAWRKAFPGDISIYSYYRKYAWRSLPVVIPRYMQADLRWYAKLPVQGVSSYAEPGDWGTYELNHYVLGRLAWNPNVEVDTVIRDFTAARFGTAAPVVRGVLDTLEQTVRRYGNIPGTTLKSAEELASSRSGLEQALARIRSVREGAGGSTALALDRLRLAVEYARRDLEIQQSRAANAPVAVTSRLVQELSAFLRANDGKGVFLVHSRLDPDRLLQSYGLRERAR